MSYQASLVNQFEFIQRNWANSEGFPADAHPTETGLDLIIGQPHATNDSGQTYKFPDPWDGDHKKDIPVRQFVTMKGGEYFFAPSISFFKDMKTRFSSPKSPLVK